MSRLSSKLENSDPNALDSVDTALNGVFAHTPGPTFKAGFLHNKKTVDANNVDAGNILSIAVPAYVTRW